MRARHPDRWLMTDERQREALWRALERLPRGSGYRVHISALDEPLPTGEDAQAECAAVINRAMERLIRQRPQQYLWGYHRYKTPRAGDAPG